MRTCFRLAHALALPLLASALPLLADSFSWQRSNAEVLPHGDLGWAPEPYRFAAGSTVRYIDFASGDDQAPGDTPSRPWKRHPWDPAATGASKAFSPDGPVTYVFKRGVEYRGRLVAPPAARAPGSAEEPVRLTSDPDWGEGQAVLLGSERITGWSRGGLPDMPDSDRVWRAEIDFAPRTLWIVGADGGVERQPLARHPNWRESDPNEPMSEWPVWENPQWWKQGNRFHTTEVNGRKRHQGVSAKILDRPAADYVGATVWTEWGIVMGSPYPAQVEAFDETKKAVAFRGPWTWEQTETIMAGNRFHLEDKPWMLDEPGEFWVRRGQRGEKSVLYFRPPGDRDPNTLRIEAGRRLNFIEATELTHLAVSGLSFRFTGVHWDYNIPSWAHPDLQNAAIRLIGPARSITVSHCVFEHVAMAARITAPAPGEGRIGLVRLADNLVRDTDHGAFTVLSSFGRGNEAAAAAKALAADPAAGRVEHIDVLRNKLERIGFRIISGEHGHAVDLRYPHSSEMSGNSLHRIAGWGLSVFGGKPSDGGAHIAALDAPFSRHLIHHNRVEDVLLKSNDWGGIETWQGGPFYVWNNLVINPRAFKNWTAVNLKPDGVPSFGHAYYMDGSFKNYLFNNIAQGRSSKLGTKEVNTSAVQGIIGFENTFFHNTFFRFANGTRQQQPDAGRLRFTANVFEDITAFVFRNADPKDVAPDPNAGHFKQGGAFDYPTLGYSRNVFFNTPGRFVFEETGVPHERPEPFADALRRVGAQASSTGAVVARPPLRAPAEGDFRPSADSPALGQGVRVFVPWGLRGVVGEWKFVRNRSDPALVLDESWYMHAPHVTRAEYRHAPRPHLRGVNVSAENYVAGPLETWADGPGALRLDGRDRFLRVSHSEFVVVPPPPAATTTYDLGWATVEAPVAIVANQPAVLTFTLKQALPEGHRLAADLHWNRRNGPGGVNASGSRAEPVAGRPDTYAVTVKPVTRAGLSNYVLTAYTSASGWAERAQTARQTIPAGKAAPSYATEDLRNLDIRRTNFLVELHLRATSPDAVLVRKQADDTGPGYELSLRQGRPVLRLRDASGASAEAVADVSLVGSEWRHLVVEADRAAGIRFHVDGKPAGGRAGALPAGSLSNPGDFLVGGGPGLAHFEGDIEYLRVAQSTLAESRTSIEELHAWQFAGPQFRDFAGNPREADTAAGALVR
jgi:hypothetical protein